GTSLVAPEATPNPRPVSAGNNLIRATRERASRERPGHNHANTARQTPAQSAPFTRRHGLSAPVAKVGKRARFKIAYPKGFAGSRPARSTTHTLLPAAPPQGECAQKKGPVSTDAHGAPNLNHLRRSDAVEHERRVLHPKEVGIQLDFNLGTRLYFERPIHLKLGARRDHRRIIRRVQGVLLTEVADMRVNLDQILPLEHTERDEATVYRQRIRATIRHKQAHTDQILASIQVALLLRDRRRPRLNTGELDTQTIRVLNKRAIPRGHIPRP